VPVNHLGIFETTLPLLEGPNRIEAASLNRAGESARSAEVLVVRDTSLPAAPSGLRAMARSGGRILLEWVPGIESYRGYHVYRAALSFSDRGQATRLTAVPIPASSFEDTPPVDGEWFYRIAQVNVAGVEGLLSAEVTIEADRTPPTAAIDYQPPASYDPATGRVGRGIVGVLLNLSEPVEGTPFLSLTMSGGQPILIDLTRVDPIQYRGSFAIDDATVSGTAVAVFSARDRAGNRGSRITSGGRLVIATPFAWQRNVTPPAARLEAQPWCDPTGVARCLDGPETLVGLLTGELRSPLGFRMHLERSAVLPWHLRLHARQFNTFECHAYVFRNVPPHAPSSARDASCR